MVVVWGGCWWWCGVDNGGGVGERERECRGMVLTGEMRHGDVRQSDLVDWWLTMADGICHKDSRVCWFWDPFLIYAHRISSYKMLTGYHLILFILST
ncbi:hypothetical protein HanRHA438_Chr05g0214701 [Helianthus annuus]|nr:hypothetical protein HanRHA438_Chr05g0214701 [Helianthus annuus]